ncbi:MAG: HD domain-containing protein [Proteobacteria bacterium]|nr:MAG: HD domain-containing protein [Pseudomonadota bacterium]
MGLNIVRRIRDNLHGSIDVSELEDAVMAHPFFQRLRRVRQLAFLHYVFPGATHTRFEHSMGVMHLAARAWEKLQTNQERLRHTVSNIQDFKAFEEAADKAEKHGRLWPTFAMMDQIFQSDYSLQTFRLAALLHDVGHPAFSHSGEHFMPSWVDVREANTDLPDYLLEYIDNRIAEIKSRGDDPKVVKVRHEIYSILLIDKILKGVYEKNPQLRLIVDPRDVIAMINPAIQPAAGSPLLSSQTSHVLRELISGELDIDRMDYLLRDSRECGVVYGVFDVDRILDSLGLYFDDEDQQIHVAIHLSGLAAFEDYLRARYSMYLQLYFHKSAVAAEAMMRHLCNTLGDWRLPAKIENYAAIDEYNIGNALWEAAKKLPTPLQEETIVLVADLLYNRKLWKRIYEVTAPRNKPVVDGLEKVKALLTANKITFQEISSENSLTRFQPKGGGARSRNYLRLIKKDEQQLHRICAIEDYSSLIASNDSVAIRRIYASPDQTHSLTEIKAVITEGMQKPKVK